MNARDSLEDRLEAIGTLLRSRPSLADRVMKHVRDDTVAENPTSALPPVIQVQPRRRFLGTAAVAVLAICALTLLPTLFPSSSSVGWAQVAQALNAQSWIRGQVSDPNGKVATVWFSPERQIWAFKIDPSISFFDGREYAKYEYHGAAPITKLPLGESDAQRVLPLDAIAAGEDVLGPWLLGEAIVQQQRREVTENGKPWIEFQLTLARGDMNEGLLRVDPESKLPVSLLLMSPANKVNVSKYVFDYPAEGPADIYALGVPRETKIEEPIRMEGTVEVLKAIAASRAKIGKFQLIVGHPVGGLGDGPAFPSSLVNRDRSRWCVDGCFPPDLPAAAIPPEGSGWGLWAADQVRRGTLVPLFACDGRTIWENMVFPAADGFRWEVSKNATPHSLMSGHGLGMLPKSPYANFAALLYPDLAPHRDWSFEIDSKPADYPGCLLVKRSAEMTTPDPLIGHEWYYLDPAKGHVVVRIELFTEAPGKPGTPETSKSRQIIEMRDFQQAPAGWWYCTEIVDIMPGQLPDGPLRRTTVRYAFDFTADLPAEFGPPRFK